MTSLPHPSEPWSRSAWQARPAAQQPTYSEPSDLAAVKARLAALPPLVSVREIQRLRGHLAKVAEGQAFLLQGGDCAESFREFSQRNLLSYFRVMLQMAVTLVYGVARPVVKVGRVAGQFAKPRSDLVETRNGVTLPSYRGDMVNGIEFTTEARQPDPQRLLQVYWQSSATLNYLHALSRDGYAAVGNVARWTSEFVRDSARAETSFQGVVDRIHEYIAFAEACGLSVSETEQLARLEFYTSHEALLLDYEEPLTRYEEPSGVPYDCSAHMVWIGNRTRQLDGAHVDFVRGIANPLGVKIGTDLDGPRLIELIDALNPHDQPGRLVLISRMGADQIEKHLPPLVEAVERAGRWVVWSCDPMHGNTIKSQSGYKTRRFDDILREVRSFFAIHKDAGTYPGGVHFEMTGQDVTECTGGMQVISDEDLNDRYHTHCDPRLNGSQALELAFLVAEELRSLPRVAR